MVNLNSKSFKPYIFSGQTFVAVSILIVEQQHSGIMLNKIMISIS